MRISLIKGFKLTLYQRLQRRKSVGQLLMDRQFLYIFAPLAVETIDRFHKILAGLRTS